MIRDAHSRVANGPAATVRFLIDRLTSVTVDEDGKLPAKAPTR